MRTLVAYFTWSGNTKEIAERIARKTHGKLFRIERDITDFLGSPPQSDTQSRY